MISRYLMKCGESLLYIEWASRTKGKMTGMRYLTFLLLLTWTAAAGQEWRDPFWPVGYRPKSETPPPPPVVAPSIPDVAPPPPPPPPKPVANWEAARKLLIITGYAEKDGKKRCILNGRLLQEGDLVSVLHASMRYTWRIVEIGPTPDLMKFEEVSFESPGNNSRL